MIERVWYEGQSGRRVWMAPDEMAIVFDATVFDAIVVDAKGPSRREAQTRFERTAPQAKLMRQDGPVAYYKLPPDQSPRREAVAARREPGVRHAGPVFYQNPNNPRSAMALSGDIIVSFHTAPSAQALEHLAKRYGLTFVQALSYAPNTFIFDARSASDSLDLANTIRTSEGVAGAHPNWIRSFGKR
ncbi:MAG: hypothetical protein HYS05_01720 [Acidobacteria bacterium]|nr:hypothetical protein [Acidobacteriota bacterium]